MGSPSWLSRKEFRIVKAVKKVGSGVKGHRGGLVGEFCDPKARGILVEWRKRLMRVGFK
ncbi:hypothetical protein MPNT_80089 [Candidatus Methylacidithermus pantelleriae]|uniref:Uncharacterized protein n=1 Tax=Candidatus Methylacidithermus pantelleriae TaxID=2744239 RepID=A0A8J2FTS0_9BACT|nr:hypothetical protein MPNT_690003 [Candidatus Methylacidithermus pantelleriae]CAF0705058.1 hypothetical protein MPNT_80089 [Candidatus Methylacidithermus pantelleriae]